MALSVRISKLEAKEEGLDPDEVVESTKAMLDKYMPLYGTDVDGMVEAVARDEGLDPEELRQEMDRMRKKVGRRL